MLLLAVVIPLDRATGRGKGFGFVKFTEAEHAQAAQELDGSVSSDAQSLLNLSCGDCMPVSLRFAVLLIIRKYPSAKLVHFQALSLEHILCLLTLFGSH